MTDYFFCSKCGCRVASTSRAIKYYPRAYLLYKQGWAMSRIFCYPCYTEETVEHPVDLF